MSDLVPSLIGICTVNCLSNMVLLTQVTLSQIKAGQSLREQPAWYRCEWRPSFGIARCRVCADLHTMPVVQQQELHWAKRTLIVAQFLTIVHGMPFRQQQQLIKLLVEAAGRLMNSGHYSAPSSCQLAQ